jgi:hypothetical protein
MISTHKEHMVLTQRRAVTKFNMFKPFETVAGLFDDLDDLKLALRPLC